MPIRYPTGADYREALFNTRRCFDDANLTCGSPTLDAMGLPKAISGNFASVFTIAGVDGRKWAVKCFTRHVADQHVRYGRISSCLQHAKPSPPWAVPFEYLPEGILCGGQRYPVVKMEWMEATAFLPYVEKNLWRQGAIARLAGEFAAVARDLSQRGIAHGDLQHGNLLVATDGRLRLVDYDGMYVPGLEDLGASELGHPNYQSPARSPGTWGPELDRFSVWLIYCTLVALSIEPLLWGWLHQDGDEALLFTKTDFESPGQSIAIRALAQSPDARMRDLERVLASIVTGDPRRIPPFDVGAVPQPSDTPLSAFASGSTGVEGTIDDATKAISDWLATHEALSPQSSSASEDPSWVLGHLPPVQRVGFGPTAPSPLNRQAAVAVALILIGLVSLLGTGVLALPLFLVALAIVVGALLLVSLRSLRNTPEWVEKRCVAAEYRKQRSEATSARRALERAISGRQDVDRVERQELDRLTKLAKRAIESERSELDKFEADLARRLASIDAELEGLVSAEQKERASALRVLQESHIANSLSGATIASANLSGIGGSLKRSLAQYGITSAADFNRLAYARTQVCLVLRSGQLVHPRGIGERKAQTLLGWRNWVEMRARATQPSVLPEPQTNAIRLKYAERRVSLDRSTNQAKFEATRTREAMKRKWMASRGQLAAQVEAARVTFARQRDNADLGLIGARRLVASAAWQEALGKHRLSAYSAVTYRHFLARGVRRR